MQVAVNHITGSSKDKRLWLTIECSENVSERVLPRIRPEDTDNNRNKKEGFSSNVPCGFRGEDWGIWEFLFRIARFSGLIHGQNLFELIFLISQSALARFGRHRK